LPPYKPERIEELRESYSSRVAEIEARVEDFRRFLDKDEEDVFAEMCFCLCTPQSKAKACDRAIERLKESGALFSGTEEDICSELRQARFCESKARYMVEAREQFTSDRRIQIKGRLSGHLDPEGLREWVVRNVKGLGYKESSHFLRNIGLGLDLAILDRHILKNLKAAGVIDTIPASLSRKTYLEIERKTRAFSEEIGIPMMHLDLLLWSMETGEIFR
jgi:N-glycosylase/DNA lyase